MTLSSVRAEEHNRHIVLDAHVGKDVTVGTSYSAAAAAITPLTVLAHTEHQVVMEETGSQNLNLTKRQKFGHGQTLSMPTVRTELKSPDQSKHRV